MADVAGFRAYFAPTFNSRGDGELAPVLAAVEARVSDSWGAERDEMIYLYMADLLESTPAGRAARAKAGLKGPTTYAITIRERELGHGWGLSRLGSGS